MKAITLHQPWASAVSLGLKRFETRSWATRYRGPILIHAGRTIDWVIRRASIIRLSAMAPDLVAEFDLHSAMMGKIVAVSELVECRFTDESGCTVDRWTDLLPELEEFFGDFSPGRWAWQLENVIRLREPVPCRGAQGLWVPPAYVVEQVMEMSSCDSRNAPRAGDSGG